MIPCKICKKNFLKIHIHHIDGNHENNNPKNKVYLCEKHHNQVHRIHTKLILYKKEEIEELKIIIKLKIYRKLFKEHKMIDKKTIKFINFIDAALILPSDLVIYLLDNK